jgi:Tfp pilus assembly protein PilV
MLNKRRVTNQKPEKGMAMMITLVAMLIIAVVAFGMLAITTSYTRQTAMYSNSQRAYYAARAGISRAMEVIEAQVKNENYTSNHNLSASLGSAGSFTAKVTYHSDNSKVSYERKLWLIESTGTYNNATRKLTTWVERETFAAFSYLSDEEKVDGSNTVFWTTGEFIGGRTHTNGYFSFWGKPEFIGKVTSANQADSRWNAGTRLYNHQYKGSVWDPAYFYQVANSGSEPVGQTDDFFFAGGVPEISLPTNIGDLKNKAHPSNQYDVGEIRVEFFPDGSAEITQVVVMSRLTNAIGVSLEDYKNMTSAEKAAVNEAHKQYLLDNPTASAGEKPPPPPGFSYLPSNIQMAMTEPEESFSNTEQLVAFNYKHSYSSRGLVGGTQKPPPDPPLGGWPQVWYTKTDPKNSDDLIVHNTGRITVYGSQLKGKVTLLSETGVFFTGSLTYVPDTNSVLGVISNDRIWIWRGYNQLGDVEIHGALMALNGGIETYQYDIGGPRGFLRIMGSVIVKHPGKIGLYDGSGGLLSGYKTIFNYDPKLLYYPPLAFPNTNKVQIVYLHDHGALGK